MRGPSKRFSIAGAGPTDGLHRGDMMPRQFSDEIPEQVLVKQNAHCPGRPTRIPALHVPGQTEQATTPVS